MGPQTSPPRIDDLEAQLRGTREQVKATRFGGDRGLPGVLMPADPNPTYYRVLSVRNPNTGQRIVKQEVSRASAHGLKASNLCVARSVKLKASASSKSGSRPSRRRQLLLLWEIQAALLGFERVVQKASEVWESLGIDISTLGARRGHATEGAACDTKSWT